MKLSTICLAKQKCYLNCYASQMLCIHIRTWLHCVWKNFPHNLHAKSACDWFSLYIFFKNEFIYHLCVAYTNCIFQNQSHNMLEDKRRPSTESKTMLFFAPSINPMQLSTFTFISYLDHNINVVNDKKNNTWTDIIYLCVFQTGQ